MNSVENKILSNTERAFKLIKRMVRSNMTDLSEWGGDIFVAGLYQNYWICQKWQFNKKYHNSHKWFRVLSKLIVKFEIETTSKNKVFSKAKDPLKIPGRDLYQRNDSYVRTDWLVKNDRSVKKDAFVKTSTSVETGGSIKNDSWMKNIVIVISDWEFYQNWQFSSKFKLRQIQADEK